MIKTDSHIARSAVPILLLLLSLTFSRCDSEDRIDPRSFTSHWAQGSLYHTSDKKNSPFSRQDLSQLLDSIRLSSKIQDHWVTLNDSDGVSYSLGIGFPANLSPDKPHPLVIYLHGGVKTDVSTKGRYAYKMLNGLKDSMDLILASPSANNFAPWWSDRGLKRILQTIRYISLHYKIDSRKIFLAGVSDGATGCYAAANSINGPFAGFFAISGYGGILPHLGTKLSLANLKKRPIYNIQGGKDRLYPLHVVNRFLDFLEEKDVHITRKVHPEEDHGFDYRKKEFPKLTQLIRSWSRPNENGFEWEVINGVINAPNQLIGYELTDENRKATVRAELEKDTFNIDSRNLSSFSFFAPSGLEITASNPSQKKFTISELPSEDDLAVLYKSLKLVRNHSLYTINFRR
ncbi:MAG: hypothetical protein ACLFQB_00695 [Chitinispirillaceae bacterium]